MSSVLTSLRLRLPLSQVLVVGELVVRRQERVRFAVSLDLGRLVERLPLRPGICVLAGQRLLGDRVDHREHEPIRQVAVVGDGQNIAAGLVLVGLEKLPEILRIRAALRRIGRGGHRLASLVGVVPVDDYPVQVLPRWNLRGPLVADEGGEAARFVVPLGGLDRLRPGLLVRLAVRPVHHAFGELAAGERIDNLEGDLHSLTFLNLVVPLPPGGIGEEVRSSGEEIGKPPHVVRVVRYDEEIERPGQSHPPGRGGLHLLAAGESIGVVRVEPGTKGPRVHRERGVKMCVAPEHPGRDGATGVG